MSYVEVFSKATLKGKIKNKQVSYKQKKIHKKLYLRQCVANSLVIPKCISAHYEIYLVFQLKLTN